MIYYLGTQGLTNTYETTTMDFVVDYLKKQNESKRWNLEKKGGYFLRSVGEPFTKKTRATNIQKPKKRNR